MSATPRFAFLRLVDTDDDPVLINLDQVAYVAAREYKKPGATIVLAVADLTVEVTATLDEIHAAIGAIGRANLDPLA